MKEGEVGWGGRGKGKEGEIQGIEEIVEVIP